MSVVSEVYGGRNSDKEVTVRSGLIDRLERCDMIMADRGFEIQELVTTKGISVNVPLHLGVHKKFRGVNLSTMNAAQTLSHNLHEGCP